MTVGDIKETLNPIKGGKTILFRPTKGNSFVELDADALNKAFDEIAAKIAMVEAGILEFTAAEKILFELFMNHAEYGG